MRVLGERRQVLIAQKAKPSLAQQITYKIRNNQNILHFINQVNILVFTKILPLFKWISAKKY